MFQDLASGYGVGTRRLTSIERNHGKTSWVSAIAATSNAEEASLPLRRTNSALILFNTQKKATATPLCLSSRLASAATHVARNRPRGKRVGLETKHATAIKAVSVRIAKVSLVSDTVRFRVHVTP